MNYLKLTLVFIYVNCVFGRRISRNGTDYDDYHNSNSSSDPTKSICHYTDPNVADCIQRIAEQARHLLAQGVPSLNIQPLEPLKIPSIRLRQHNMPKNSFKYDAWLSDVALEGLTNYTFNKLKSMYAAVSEHVDLKNDKRIVVANIFTAGKENVYPEELKVTANISLPHLMMSGDYVVLGDFQMLPVESTGKMAANFTQCTAALEALGAKVHKRMVIRDATVHLRCTGPLKASLMEAHSTTGEMEMITDHIAHMHSTDIAKEVQPAVETALGMVLEDVANKFLKHIPQDMVFPN